MGEEQRQALARLFAEDEAFRTALASVASIEDAVRIAQEHEIGATAEDFRVPSDDLSDADLEAASGGGMFLYPTADVFCGTQGNFCTFNRHACGQ